MDQHFNFGDGLLKLDKMKKTNMYFGNNYTKETFFNLKD